MDSKKEVAEREGFEPPVPCGTVVFKTTVIDHSTISPFLFFVGAKVLFFLFPRKFFGIFFPIPLKIGRRFPSLTLS